MRGLRLTEQNQYNAEEMMKKLELMSNRARQAKITTELTEIVNGAQQAEKM